MPRIWSTLINILWALEKKVNSTVVAWSITYRLDIDIDRCQLDPVNYIVGFFISLLTFGLVSISTDEPKNNYRFVEFSFQVY